MEGKTYSRYLIHTKETANLISHPHRFNVKVKRWKLAKLLLKELIHYRGNLEVVKSRPCIYGVFSGPIGGFAPRSKYCVGCLRCTTQYPEMAFVYKNEALQKLGDSYFTPAQYDTVIYEAETGRVPIRGAGYRGSFGGKGWDSLWTDMSEIVRPTRDGIHGREHISTEVDLGGAMPFLQFDANDQPINTLPSAKAALPLLFDVPPSTRSDQKLVLDIFKKAAHHLHTFAIVPIELIDSAQQNGKEVIPLVAEKSMQRLGTLKHRPRMIEMAEWSPALYHELRQKFPETGLILRVDGSSPRLLEYYKAGVHLFHLAANFHGRSANNQFIMEMIHQAHHTFLKASCREEVTLIGSGGIISAEHMPKAILCGLDAVAIETALLVALQAKFQGDCVDRENSLFETPKGLTEEWGKQRLINLAGSWHSQLLEILGAMGLREVRRLRGEMGRAMWQKDFENEAFRGIEGYEVQ